MNKKNIFFYNSIMEKNTIFILLLFIFYKANCAETNCKTFHSYSIDRCIECKPNFYLTYDERDCEECDEQQGKILSLVKALYSNNQVNKCFTKVDNCKEYSKEDDFCELCENDFKRDENILNVEQMKLE
jgi:hypothetical protein